MPTKSVEKIMEGNLEERFRDALFAAHLNHDSLARHLTQDSMLTIDFLIKYLNGCLYAALDRSIQGDEDTMNKLQEIINEVLSDLKDLQKNLFNKGKSND